MINLLRVSLNSLQLITIMTSIVFGVTSFGKLSIANVNKRVISAPSYVIKKQTAAVPAVVQSKYVKDVNKPTIVQEITEDNHISAIFGKKGLRISSVKIENKQKTQRPNIQGNKAVNTNQNKNSQPESKKSIASPIYHNGARHRSVFDISMYGFFGAMPIFMSSIISGNPFAFGRTSIMLPLTFGGGVNLSLGTEEIFMFLNIRAASYQGTTETLLQTTDGLPNTGLGINGQLGIGYNVAKLERHNVYVIKLFGIEGTYNDVSNMINTQSIQLVDLFDISAKYFSIGLLFGVEFKEYVGTRHIFSQRITGSVGVGKFFGNTGPYGAVERYGLAVNAAINLDYSYALNQAQTVYLRLFANLTASANVNFAPVNPIDIRTFNNIINGVNKLLSSVGDLTDKNNGSVKKLLDEVQNTVNSSRCLIFGEVSKTNINGGTDCATSNTTGTNGYFGEIQSEIKNLQDLSKNTLQTVKGRVTEIIGDGTCDNQDGKCGLIDQATKILANITKEVDNAANTSDFDSKWAGIANLSNLLLGKSDSVENPISMLDIVNSMITLIPGIQSDLLNIFTEGNHIVTQIMSTINNLTHDIVDMINKNTILAEVNDLLQDVENVNMSTEDLRKLIADIAGGKTSIVNRDFGIGAGLNLTIIAGIGIYIKI